MNQGAERPSTKDAHVEAHADVPSDMAAADNEKSKRGSHTRGAASTLRDKRWGWRWTGRVLRGLAIIYIAIIGILAIEELQRREKVLAVLTARDKELAAALAVMGDDRGEASNTQKEVLDRERTKLQGLKARITTLILGGSIRPNTRPLKEILCELAATRSVEVTCDGQEQDGLRDLAAALFLKRTAEQRSSGDVFAVLIVVAAIGGAAVSGALVRLYLPGEYEHDEHDDAFRTLFRAVGGGIVCYLALSGGCIPFSGTNLTAYTTPATGSLLGFLSGMFSTKVFLLLSSMVDSWVGKLMPHDPPRAEAPPSSKAVTAVAASNGAAVAAVAPVNKAPSAGSEAG
ncbi:hypothetical protein WME75_27610 [Sorangium sp. So ce1014]|uniref:hypothetical protein n=1 Tax=Sorangium sp. So ce1014 TaxID=3133326 RepID=UPI003F600E15